MSEEPTKLQRAYTAAKEYCQKRKDDIICLTVAAGGLGLAALAPVVLHYTAKKADTHWSQRLLRIKNDANAINARADQLLNEIDEDFMQLEVQIAKIEGAEQADQEHEAAVCRASEALYARREANTNGYDRFRAEGKRGAEALKVSRDLSGLVCKDTPVSNNRR
ncbi:hypothetical protein KY338_05715 [Candidatus Woesearchaeota archaeon]|nr:hypothetical protein [Candidatus Woesearchaeota archaeon]MBW3006443.1 hypothetical protein [Candidatus Woesearchaeota archaeon]